MVSNKETASLVDCCDGALGSIGGGSAKKEGQAFGTGPSDAPDGPRASNNRQMKEEEQTGATAASTVSAHNNVAPI